MIAFFRVKPSDNEKDNHKNNHPGNDRNIQRTLPFGGS